VSAKRRGGGGRFYVDGYNVLLRTKLGEGQELEERRAELLARIAATGISALVVFDSRESHPGLRSATPRRVEVAFAPPGRSADELLIERVRRAPDLDGAVIVSDDRDVADRCGMLGARTMSTAEFGRRLKPATPSTPAKERPLRPDEVKDWMKWFGYDREKP
jgi:predicted RNA-binding protein with PIN domain